VDLVLVGYAQDISLKARTAQSRYWPIPLLSGKAFAQRVRAFRLMSCGVADETQIHTHMCYAEFNEHPARHRRPGRRRDQPSKTSRSDMELLEARRVPHPNEIGPGCTTSTLPECRIPGTC